MCDEVRSNERRFSVKITVEEEKKLRARERREH